MQIVFIESDAGGFRLDADGRTVVERVIKRVQGLGAPLPCGMFARYTVTRFESGRELVEGVLQARRAGGRRYFSDLSETAAQRRLLRWSARILRERAGEVAHD
jgi:hypothetical protein